MLAVLAGFASILSAGALGSVAIQEIFTAGDQYPCYRQPVLLAFDNTVLAFVEGRNNTLCWGTKDGYPKYILYRRSTDGGDTFGSTQLLYTGNPDYLGAVRDATTGEVFLFIQGGPGVLLSSSKDGGATFSKPAAWSIDSGYSGFKPSVAHGIQIDGSMCSGEAVQAAGSGDGRLVMPFVCSGKKSALQLGRPSSTPLEGIDLDRGSGSGIAAVGEHDPEPNGDIKCAGCFSCLVLSDDHGATWRLGAVSSGQEGTREASVAQVCRSSGQSGAAQIYMNERNMGATYGHRAWALSTDGGASISSYGLEKGMVSPVTANWTGIVGGLSRASTSAGAPLLYSGPLDATARANLGVYASSDGAATWAAPHTIWDGPAGYSDAAALNSTHFAVVFEGGKEHFSEGIFLARLP